MAETCECKKDIEERLLARFKETAPEASGHSTVLTGYALVLQGNSLLQKPCMEIKAKASFPLKKGGAKEKTITENMIFNYCPFCGVKF